MISQAIATKLIKIYDYVCHQYKKDLQYRVQRHSNNHLPDFTDEEITTIYLFCVHQEKRFKVKEMYDFVKNYLSDWFPKLPSYVGFATRLNKLVPAFDKLLNNLLTEFVPQTISTTCSLIDSMPVVICSAKRSSKVAPDLANKGYNSTKDMFYYGVKIHILGFENANNMPHPERIIISKASENDLSIFKENCSDLKNRTIFGDKSYIHKDYFEQLKEQNKVIMMTPIKETKGNTQYEKLYHKAYNDTFSRAVSKVRQPIESLFNFIIEKTDIQRASKVRSEKGLLIHLMGKIAAAFLFLIFNP